MSSKYEIDKKERTIQTLRDLSKTKQLFNKENKIKNVFSNEEIKDLFFTPMKSFSCNEVFINRQNLEEIRDVFEELKKKFETEFNQQKRNDDIERMFENQTDEEDVPLIIKNNTPKKETNKTFQYKEIFYIQKQYFVSFVFLLFVLFFLLEKKGKNISFLFKVDTRIPS